MEHFAIAAPRCRAVRIISRQPAHVREPFGVGVLLFCCVLTGLLFISERQRSPSRRLRRVVVERVVSLSCPWDILDAPHILHQYLVLPSSVRFPACLHCRVQCQYRPENCPSRR